MYTQSLLKNVSFRLPYGRDGPQIWRPQYHKDTGFDISLHIVLPHEAALIFTPWGVNPGTCWMVVWFDLTQFGCSNHPAHSQISTMSYPKNCKYTHLAVIIS
jgi:hypothetical protein